MTLEKDAVLHLNSNSSKAEERRPRTIGLLLLCNHITAFFNSAISQGFFSKLKKNVWHCFREIVDKGEKQLNRDFRTTLISLFCAAQSYFFSLVFFFLVFFVGQVCIWSTSEKGIAQAHTLSKHVKSMYVLDVFSVVETVTTT